MEAASRSPGGERPWPDFAAVRRWHFYAGLVCLPFFCWLAATGSIYLFRPQIETWLDRPYEDLPLDGARPAPSAEAAAALAAMPGSAFSHYEPPSSASGASQVVVARDGNLHRVYVDPGSLQAMKIVRDDLRPMDVVAHLHGQLLLGQRGSIVVEIAGSWGVVMILTGFYLWLPRGKVQLGGLLYPRLGRRGRLFWRDLHAVSGVWISTITLLLLLTGMPWSANWGNYLTWVRNQWEATRGAPDWPIGGGADHTAHAASAPGAVGATRSELRALDALVPLAARLHVPRPVWIAPPAIGVDDWTISSHIQNRPLRVTYTVAPDGATVTGRQGYGDLNIVDRVVNFSIAAHEGQLFGWLNQAILLLNAAGIVIVTASAVVMWWQRRPAHFLGAPAPAASPRLSGALVGAVAALALVLPLFGLTLLLVLVAEKAVLRWAPAAGRWLGLEVTRS